MNPGPSKAAPVRPGTTILVVDDEPDVLETLQAWLEMSLPGSTVRTASSGEEGLRAMGDNEVDLIIADYRMPGMDGLEFLKRSLDLAPEASRVLLTAFPKLELAIQAINEVTIDKFLVKPVKGDVLVQIVRSLLDLRETRRRREEGQPFTPTPLRHAPRNER